MVEREDSVPLCGTDLSLACSTDADCTAEGTPTLVCNQTTNYCEIQTCTENADCNTGQCNTETGNCCDPSQPEGGAGACPAASPPSRRLARPGPRPGRRGASPSLVRATAALLRRMLGRLFSALPQAQVLVHGRIAHLLRSLGEDASRRLRALWPSSMASRRQRPLNLRGRRLAARRSWHRDCLARFYQKKCW